MKKYAVIVAGGKGERMENSLPKQFIEVNGLPLVMHTMNLFCRSDVRPELILVLPRAYFKIWRDLCLAHGFNAGHVLAESGPERFHSVKSGLRNVGEDDAIVAVHDAVRPLVSLKVISRVYKDAELYGSAVPVVPVTESVRERTGANNRPADRNRLFLVQTPQCFRASILKRAYLQAYREEFTDDATVVETNGQQIHLVDGNPENIKITTPADLLMAEALLKKYQ